MPKNLFNLPDTNTQSWEEFEHNGEIISFDHLNACCHNFERSGTNERYTIYFTFSHHVFTSQTSEEAVYPYDYKNDPRPFDPYRYQLSKNLPKIISTLPDQFCFHGGYGKYCSCELKKIDGSTTQYRIVYKAWKQRGKIRFHIESAYEDQIGKVKKVNFWVICFNLLKNKPLPKPPR